eukprot:TRINITY_DN17033_c0_g1_i1.p1 TRINITY_DN17033_c0_g1~~TRINITY_DN17033_c0_g1_i1.p1  ORF type:complete len:444 (+),score=184.74 TRINITY_DN17033_c0_g1_i1:108-1439(+)
MALNFATLEQKRQEVFRLRAQVEKRDRELRSQEEQLEELERQKLGISGVGDGMNDVRPEDFLDLVHRLQARIKIEELRSAQLRREIQDVRKQMYQQDLELERLESDTLQIQALTGYKPPVPGAAPVGTGLSHKEQEEAIEKILLLRRVIQKELSVRRQIILRKGQLSKKLAAQLSRMRTVEEQCYSLQNDVNVANEEKQRLEDEFEQLRKVHGSEDRQLTVYERRAAQLTTADSLSVDLSFLRQRTAQHAEAAAAAERTIRVQQSRMEQLQRRHAAVRAALDDLGLSGKVDQALKSQGQLVVQEEQGAVPTDPERILRTGELVPAVLYQLLQKDWQDIERRSETKDILLQEKETTIETVAQREAEMSQVAMSAKAREARETRLRERELQRLHDQAWDEHRKYQAELLQLRSERTAGSAARARQQGSPATASPAPGSPPPASAQ